jgi:hypothetical protein
MKILLADSGVPPGDANTAPASAEQADKNAVDTITVRLRHRGSATADGTNGRENSAFPHRLQ